MSVRRCDVMLLCVAVFATVAVQVNAHPHHHDGGDHRHHEHHQHEHGHHDARRLREPLPVAADVNISAIDPNTGSGAGVGVGVTFSANFFTKLFDTLAVPVISEFVTTYPFPSFQRGLPMGGKLTVNPPEIWEFNVDVGYLSPQYPQTFNYQLNQINIAGGTSFHARWRICCIFCFTWLSCGASIGIHAENIAITGTMDFQQSGNQVSVSSPSQANWVGDIRVHAGNAGCGWFMDLILHLFFGNLNHAVENVIENAITHANVGQKMADAVNGFFDKTLNAGFKDLHICGFQFYQGTDYMSVFTHETSDQASPCLNQILPTSLAGKPPSMDVAILARIALVPSWIPTPAPWALLGCSTKQNCLTLPFGLGTELTVTQCSLCTGIDGDLGIYIIGEIDVAVQLQEKLSRVSAARDQLLGLPPRVQKRASSSRHDGQRKPADSATAAAGGVSERKDPIVSNAKPRGAGVKERPQHRPHSCHKPSDVDDGPDPLFNAAGIVLLTFVVGVTAAIGVVGRHVVRAGMRRNTVQYTQLPGDVIDHAEMAKPDPLESS